VVVVSRFNVANAPFYLLDKLLERYKETSHPKGLYIVSDVLPAIPGFGLDKIGEFIMKERDQEGASLVFLWVGPLASGGRGGELGRGLHMAHWPCQQVV